MNAVVDSLKTNRSPIRISRRSCTLFLLTSLAGVTLGKAIFISENGGYIPPIPLASSAEGISASTPTSPGELDITITVQVGYAIE
jgi:uncharacterized protein YggE